MVSMIAVKVCPCDGTCFISYSLQRKWKRSTGMPQRVHGFGIDLAIAIAVGNHLAAAGEAARWCRSPRGSCPSAPCRSLRGGAHCPANDAELRHAEAAADLDVIAAREILLLVAYSHQGT